MNIFELLIIQPIFNLLIGLYSLIPGGDFGVAVIIFTILIRIALFPLVRRQLHQVQAMKKLQPKLAEIKAKTKGDRQAESALMLELYKEHGVNPFGSVLTLLIQLPILLALYQVIRIFTDRRSQIARYTYDFMEKIGPIHQLIQHPNQLNEKLFGVVDLTKTVFSNHQVHLSLLLIAILAAIMQYFSARQTMPQAESKKGIRQIMAEAAEGKQTEQSDINAAVSGRMVMFMPFLTLFIMIGLPGALALYYAVSNIVAVAQQGYLLNKDEQEMEILADTPTGATAPKKATASARAKTAKEGNVIRIKAKDTPKKEKKK